MRRPYERDKTTKDRHSSHPITVRLHPDDLDWLHDRLARTGEKRNSILVAAFKEYRAKLEQSAMQTANEEPANHDATAAIDAN